MKHYFICYERTYHVFDDEYSILENTEITRDSPISNINDIIQVEENIKREKFKTDTKNVGTTKITILNWKQF